jgi:hypothetical protein
MQYGAAISGTNTGTGSTGKSGNNVCNVGGTFSNDTGVDYLAAFPAQAAPSPWSPAGLLAVMPASGGSGSRKKTGPAGIPA